MNTAVLDQALELPLSEQLELVDRVWKKILKDSAIPENHQKKNEGRTASLESGEATLISGDELRSSVAAKIQKRKNGS